MRLSTLWLVVVTGVMSTTISIIGGVVMYMESKNLLHDTVKEVAKADMEVMSMQYASFFGETELVSRRFSELFARYAHTFATYEDFQYWAYVVEAGEAFNSVAVGGLGIRGHSPNISNHTGTFGEYCWWDPGANGQKHMVWSSQLKQSTAKCPFPCYHVQAIHNKTAALQGPLFNYSMAGIFPDGSIKRVAQHNLVPGDGWWGRPQVYQYPGGKYLFVTVHEVMQPQSSPMFKGLGLFTGAEMYSFPFERLAKSFGTEAHIMLAELVDEKGAIFMGNRPESQIDPECEAPIGTAIRRPCLPRVMNLSSSSQKLVRKLNQTAPETFVSHDNHWLMRRVVFKSKPQDDLNSLWLLWIRSKTSINKKLQRALFVFLGFVLGVMCFDILIGVAEVVVLASPLNKLALSTEPLQELDLEQCELEVAAATGVCIAVKEVHRVAEGLLFAVRSLKEYKAYLPKTLFDVPAEVAVELSHSAESTTSTNPSASTSGTRSSFFVRAHKTNTLTKVMLAHTKTTSLLIEADFTAAPTESDKLVTFMTEHIALLEDIAQGGRGILHPFLACRSETALMTWTGSPNKAADIALRLPGRLQVRFRAALHTGNWLAGNVGTDTCRGYAQTGEEPHTLVALQWYSAALCKNLPASLVVASDKVSSALSGYFRFLCLGAVSVRNSYVVCNQLHSAQDASNKEWMYVLTSNTVADPLRILVEEATMGVAITKEDAEESAKSHVKAGPNDVFVGEIIAQLQRHASSGGTNPLIAMHGEGLW